MDKYLAEEIRGKEYVYKLDKCSILQVRPNVLFSGAADCSLKLMKNFELERDHLKTSYPSTMKVVSVWAEPTP